MKNLKSLWLVAAVACALTAGVSTGPSAEPLPPSVSENERELLTQGDFDGDGRIDLAIVDRDTGRIRIGYQVSRGEFTWPAYKISKVKDVTGVTVGRLFEPGKDAFALVAADGNLVHLLAAASPTASTPPVPVPPPGLGPNSVVAIKVGGAGNSTMHDLAVSTTYNTPDPNKITLFRNDVGKLTKLSDIPAAGSVNHARRAGLKAGSAELLCAIVAGDDKGTFRAEDYGSGKPQTIASIPGLDADLDYLLGSFRAGGLRDVVFFKTGEKTLEVRPVEGDGAGFQFGAGSKFELEKPIKFLAAVRQGDRDGLVTIFDNGESGAVLSFDGSKAPTKLLPLAPSEGDLLSGAVSLDNGFLLVSAPAEGKIKYSTRYEIWQFKGATCEQTAKGTLPSLADTDDATVPDVHKMIVASLKEKSGADMKPYTNTIPGTDVNYVMLPIPGGEFTMGSPASEKGRQADEGPQHKVKIEPFWMGAFEITWNEYELFMYPDEERKFKDTIKTDAEVDKVSDAVTRPSKPYVEMSFGMGKDGYPAIAMSQHAAKKYCHWLSAKTGHFYRLPTEAEWEYACRAGTTTAYFFGDDASKLPEYAWFEKNSDFKYQKVGKKKPNPWGLYDISGNVVEWCLDEYNPGFYGKSAASEAVSPLNWPARRYFKVVRGGNWDTQGEACRSAARRASEPAWNAQDPQLPKSVWWLSDAQWVGFRLVRPLKVPPADDLIKFWPSAPEKD